MKNMVFGPGSDPQEAAELLANTIADLERDPFSSMLATQFAKDLILIGATALGLASTPEHVERCDHGDHSPMGILESAVSMLRNNEERLEDEDGTTWEKYWLDFWEKKRTAEALQKMPQGDLHVSDILGEGDKDA